MRFPDELHQVLKKKDEGSGLGQDNASTSGARQCIYIRSVRLSSRAKLLRGENRKKKKKGWHVRSVQDVFFWSTLSAGDLDKMKD